MTEPARLTLANDALEAVVAPHLGARLCRLRTRDGIDLVVPLDAWDAPEHGWPKAGAYPLVPYSNRIAGAQLAFGGATHALAPHPLDLPNALHGHAQRRAWSVAEHDSRAVELVLRETPCEHWPWAFEARMRFALDGAELAISFALQNIDTRTMPAGLGWHPFLATDAGSQVRFRAPCRWTLDERFVPTGATHISPDPVTLTRADWQAADCAIYASDWDGAARIERDAGTLHLQADAPLSHLVVYAARGREFVCLEPVSHVANGFNLAAQGVTGTGIVTLEPGQALHARTTLRWVPAR
ncbi:MAG: aldose 1-epimerase [Burkholderia gladioli]